MLPPMAVGSDTHTRRCIRLLAIVGLVYEAGNKLLLSSNRVAGDIDVFTCNNVQIYPSSIDMFAVAADVNPTHASNHGEY